jgi:hypothetical protein
VDPCWGLNRVLVGEVGRGDGLEGVDRKSVKEFVGDDEGGSVMC